MEVINCPNCGKIFVKTGVRLCPDCLDLENEQEHKVTEYVRDNRQATVKQIVDATGVPEKIIMRMVKDGRFKESDLPIKFPCENCGAMITQGRFCRMCSEEMSQAFGQQANSLKNKTAEKKATKGTMAINRY